MEVLVVLPTLRGVSYTWLGYRNFLIGRGGMEYCFASALGVIVLRRQSTWSSESKRSTSGHPSRHLSVASSHWNRRRRRLVDVRTL
jgi:hypothetical protein